MTQLTNDETKLAVAAVSLALREHQYAYHIAAVQAADPSKSREVRRGAARDANAAAERVNLYRQLQNRLQAAGARGSSRDAMAADRLLND